MSDEAIMKLLNSEIVNDIFLGVMYTFKKYPKLIKYVTPCTVKGRENAHQILYKDLVNNSPLFGLTNKSPGLSFNWDTMFDYLWAEKT